MTGALSRSVMVKKELPLRIVSPRLEREIREDLGAMSYSETIAFSELLGSTLDGEAFFLV